MCYNKYWWQCSTSSELNILYLSFLLHQIGDNHFVILQWTISKNSEVETVYSIVNNNESATSPRAIITPKQVRKWHTNTLFIVFNIKDYSVKFAQYKNRIPHHVGKTNSNKTMASRLNHKLQEQQRVREKFFMCLLLWTYSSNQPSYYNHHIATDICIKPANASTNHSCQSVDKPVC